MREGAVEVRKILAELWFTGHFSPGGHGKKLVNALEGKTHFAVTLHESFSQDFTPVLLRLGNIHFVAADPGDPFGDLGLMAPGHVTDRVESILDIDGQIESIFAGHVAVMESEDDRDFDRLGFLAGIEIRVLRCEGVRDINHVGYLADSFGNADMVDVDASQRIRGIGRSENVVGLEFTNFFP